MHLKMNESTHILVLFPCSTQYKQRILDDLRAKFRVWGLYEIEWSVEFYKANYHRLFFERHSKPLDWVNKCGFGTITCVIIDDISPIYTRRQTSTGFDIVNDNVYLLEKKYQEWMNNPHGVFASLHEIESIRTSLLLLHCHLDDLRNQEMLATGETKSLSQDLPGAKQWDNLQQLFYFLGAFSDYVVWDCAESECSYKILIKDACATLYSVLNVSEKSIGKRKRYIVNVRGKAVDLEFWNISNDYFDTKWIDAAFKTKQNTKGFWSANSEHAFYLYIYNVIFHRPTINEDMALKADILWEAYRSESLANIPPGARDCDQYWFMLKNWMNVRGYQFVRHKDSSLAFNEQILELDEICKKLHAAAGFNGVRPIMVNQYGGGGYKYFLAYEGNKKMFVKWGGIGNSARMEYEATRMLYSLCPKHVAKPGIFYANASSKFYAMEYLEGKSLRNLLDEGSLTEEDRISICQQLESLSSMLFEAKLIHRDIRPENLFVTQGGVLKLIDCQWAIQYDSYSEMAYVRQNPRLIRHLGVDYAVAKYVWDDHFSINKLMDALLGINDQSPAHQAVRNRIGKQVLRFFAPPNGTKAHQDIPPKLLYELHREWLQEYGNEEQVYQLDREWLMKTADEKAVYLPDRAW